MTDNKDNKHTPLPWWAERPEGVNTIESGDGRISASIGTTYDAAFIVQACNAHEALVEACERALSWMLECEAETGEPMQLGYKGRMQKPVVAEKLRAALAKAKGEK